MVNSLRLATRPPRCQTKLRFENKCILYQPKSITHRKPQSLELAGPPNIIDDPILIISRNDRVFAVPGRTAIARRLHRRFTVNESILHLDHQFPTRFSILG